MMKKITSLLVLTQALSLSASSADAPNSSPATSSRCFVGAPSDAYFVNQWALCNDASASQEVMIDKDDLHTFFQTGTAGFDIGYLDAQEEVSQLAKAPVTVAVIDSGLDANHQDLVGRVAPGGWDFLTNTPTVLDDMGHGTHVSGIIAANANNGIGVAGIAPATVQILPLRILSQNFTGFSYPDPKAPANKPNRELVSQFAADAINYAVAHNAKVINMSLGWPKIVDTPESRDAVKNAIAHNVLMVVAAGNDQKNKPTYPCAYEGVLCVGATTNNGQIAIFSNSGGAVDVIAPGDGIWSLYPGATAVVPRGGQAVESRHSRIQGYEFLSGTSQASPMVAAIAATLLSTNPNMPMNELKARILLSGGGVPVAGASLYGNVNLKRALDAQPQPVYLPDFKNSGEAVVDEKSLTVSGQLNVTNLWLASSGVSAQITINGKTVGSVSVDALDSGKSFTIPWQYTFGSLDESAELALDVKIQDKNGTSREFTGDVSVERAVLNMTSTKIVPVPPTADGSAPNWLLTENNYNFLNINKVNDYGVQTGLPIYYIEPTADKKAATLEIFDPSKSPTPINLLHIPGIYWITQVLRMDANRDGNMQWVVAGMDQNKTYLQFTFMNDNFQPLWGTPDASTWRTAPSMFSRMAMFLDFNSQTPHTFRGYAGPGSWLQSNGKLVPCFFAQGPLPDYDNWDELDPRHNGGSAPSVPGSNNHLYCSEPQAIANGVTPLVIHALDNKDVRTKYPTMVLRNQLPQSLSDEIQGHSKVLFTLGAQLDAETHIWNLDTIASTDYPAVRGWNTLASAGTPYSAIAQGMTENSAAFVNYFDTERGSIAWSTPDGQYTDTSEFSFFSSENPIQNTTGIFDFGSFGRFWFIETQFNLVGFHQASGKTTVDSQILPLERDSTFPGGEFSEMFAPIAVGTTANPEAGIYINSTTVRGNQVSVAVWNSQDGKFEKPLRYSLQIPDGCSQSDPFHSTDAVESFTIPLFCKNANKQLEMQLVSPSM